ncbi:site-specific integrase [Mucilaginibacter auburnensis]|uniref:Site-specific recombinase XerD n=1 Tax=Mucilaginibacter auburnensis TaxID=1457233 RepID=A0A2H9VR51_9SPHI|nr:site-specific integrase [Mucilaginibacter auburnensis]PJJ83295.1 site-specific recombinase XerD [Mucilaginibacter auburnensis]
MKNSDSFAILFWANKAKKDQNGTLPVYARVTIAGKRAEISLKKKVMPEKWDARSGFMKGSGEEARSFNKFLVSVDTELRDLYFQFKQNGRSCTAERLKNKYLHAEEPLARKQLLEVFTYHNEEVAALVGKDLVKATLTKYETIRTKVADYIAHRYQCNDLFLDELEYNFITGFEHYMKTQQLVSHNVVMAYIKRIKRVVNMAVDNGWLAASPIRKYVCTSKKTARTELEAEELAALEEKHFEVERLEEVKDCYLFSCYTGYAFIDACKLSVEHLVKGSDGEYWVMTSRTKSKIAANVPLLPQALAIIDKYRAHPIRKIQGRLLPMKSNQKMNAYLKEIADLCGINKKLTTHTARHTFATTVTLENDVPIETVSKMLGHTKITTTQIYARIKEKKVSKDMKLLREKLTLKPAEV